MFTFTGSNWWRKFKANRSLKRISLFILFLSSCIIWITLYDNNFEYKSTAILNDYSFGVIENSINSKDGDFLVNSSKCQIINLDPFTEDAMQFFHPQDYEPCTQEPLLTFITYADNVVTLNVNNAAASFYRTTSVVCCYSNVTRKQSADNPDDEITTTECQMFKNSIILHHDTITVKCFSEETHEVIYENAHSAYLINDHVKAKMNKRRSKEKISVLLIGIDSISRLHFIRALPKTYNYVKNHGWIPLKGYNKMDDNTFPNLMAILTGYNNSHVSDICDPTKHGAFDNCPMLWYSYKNLGYVTSFAEDECVMSTFNFRKKGFTSPPTDYYFRPYMLASETLATKERGGMTYCSGPETSGERILNLAKDFAITFKETPHFGMFWTNTFSHNELNTVSGMDDKLKEFLETLHKENVLEQSVVIFLSDHGIRFGDIRLTDTGWLEERLPFIYVSFPNWFKQTFTVEYNNFVTNSHRLTSPYDLHMTLQHLLVLSGDDFTMSPSTGCSSCKSLLEEFEKDRSCEDAGIEQHWCTCSGYTRVRLNKEIEDNISGYVVQKVNKIIASHSDGYKCAKYVVNKIISTSFAQKLPYTNKNYLLLKFETKPRAVFESTINFKGNISDLNFSISGGISRLDRYFKHSSCVKHANLKKYCYCT